MQTQIDSENWESVNLGARREMIKDGDRTFDIKKIPKSNN